MLEKSAPTEGRLDDAVEILESIFAVHLDIPPYRHADVADSHPEFIYHSDHPCSLLYSSIALFKG